MTPMSQAMLNSGNSMSCSRGFAGESTDRIFVKTSINTHSKFQIAICNLKLTSPPSPAPPGQDDFAQHQDEYRHEDPHRPLAVEAIRGRLALRGFARGDVDDSRNAEPVVDLGLGER